MATTRGAAWPTFDRLSSLRDELDQFFESSLAPFTQTSSLLNGWTPTIDLYEDKDNFIVKAELPGMKKADIEISLHEGTLALAGEHKQEQRREDAETYREERFYGRFHRTIALPKLVAADKVKAAYKDGVLTVTLPKTEEVKPKQIEVSVK